MNSLLNRYLFDDVGLSKYRCLVVSFSRSERNDGSLTSFPVPCRCPKSYRVRDLHKTARHFPCQRSRHCLQQLLNLLRNRILWSQNLFFETEISKMHFSNIQCPSPD